MKKILWLISVLLFTCPHVTARERLPIPNRIVVLTFDDSVKSHFTVVRSILKQHGFDATCFITEGFDFRKTNKRT